MLPDSTADSESLRLRRLAGLHATIAAVFAILVGGVTALQFCYGLAKFGGLEYVPRVSLLSGVRVLGPAATTSAALLALLIWTHRIDVDALKPILLRAAPWVLLMALAGAPVTTLLTVASGLLTAHWVYGVSWDAIVASRGILARGDFLGAAETFVLTGALVGVFCWYALPAMSRRSWSLLRKIAATGGASIVVRVVSELAAAASRLAEGMSP